MATKAAVPFLVGMMLLTGVCNTLLTKYQVRIESTLHHRIEGVLTLPVHHHRTTNASATAMTPTPRTTSSSSSP